MGRLVGSLDDGRCAAGGYAGGGREAGGGRARSIAIRIAHGNGFVVNLWRPWQRLAARGQLPTLAGPAPADTPMA